MAYGRKYYKEFDGYNAATGQTYTVLVDIYEDGFAGTAIEIEEISASPLQLSLDSSGDPLYTAIKKTSATFNIINTNQFDYSEFYTSNAKKYKMMITSTVFNWTGYLVPQAVSFDLATNGEFSLTASDGLHLLQSIDYVAAENDMTTLADFLTDIEAKIGLSTFNRTSTINTEYGDIWNSLIYEGMFTNKTYEEAFEMVLKAIGMQVRYWKITPIISIESVLQTASVKCVNDYPELNFLAPIKTAKLTKNIITLPSAFKNALVDDISDLTPRAANSYYTLSNWTVVSDNGLVVFDIGANETDRKANKYKAINMFVKPTNAPYDTQRLTGNEGSYFQLRPVQKTPFTLSFNANFGRISEYGRSSADGYRSYIHPVKWSSIKWGLYDSISNKSYSKTTNSWSITGTPTASTANELEVTDPADSFVDVYIPIPAPTGVTANLRFYLFTGAVEYVNAAPVGESRTNRLSIKSIDIDGEYVVSENELYTAVNGAVAVGDNIDVLDYDVDFGSVPTPPLNTSLYYGSAFFDNNLNQLEDIIIGANTVSHEQYLFNTILYTQNEIRKKVYTANVNMLTNVSPFWLKTTLKTDTVMVNACSFDFKTSQLNGEFTEIMPYVYREWAITSEREIGSSDWGGSGGTTGGSGGGGTVDTSNFVVKTGAVTQNIEGSVTVEGAVVAGATNGVLPDDLPVATSSLYGVVKFDAATLGLNGSGQLTVIGGGWSNVSWGTPTAQYSPLTINSVTRNLSVDGHTHSYLPLSGGNLTGALTISGSNVWHAGNDGAGSGLDADLLDGVHGDKYFTYRGSITNSTDANSLTNMGMWLNTTGNGSGNTRFPVQYGYIQSFSSGAENYGKWQMSIDNTADNIHIRAEWAGVWGGWKKLWHSANSNLKTVDWNAKDLKCVNTFADGAVVAGALNGTLPDDLPVATDSLYGVVKIDGVTIKIDANGKIYANETGGVSSWNDLTDKPANLTALAALTGAGIVRRNSDGSFSIDTSAYLTSITKTMVENVLTGIITSHQHNYLPLSGGTLSGKLYIDRDNVNNIIGFRNNGVDTVSFGYEYTQGGLTFYNFTSTKNLFIADNGDLKYDNFIVKSSGNVGIGTTSPSYKLDVNGTFRTTGASYLNSTLSVTGTSTFTGLLTANGGINATTGTFSSYVTAQRFYTGYDSGQANSMSCSNWFRSNGATGWLNATYTAGILSDTANIVRTYSTNKFKVYNTAIDSILTLGGVTAANVVSSGSVVAGALNGTLPNDLPVATSAVFGVVKTGASINNNAGVVNINGRHYTTTSTYTDASVREITAELALGTGSMANGTLDQIQLSFAPLTTTRGLTANVIATNTGAGMGLKLSFRKDAGTGRWYIMIYNDSGAAVTRDGILLSIRGQQTI